MQVASNKDAARENLAAFAMPNVNHNIELVHIDQLTPYKGMREPTRENRSAKLPKAFGGLDLQTRSWSTATTGSLQVIVGWKQPSCSA
jgi:hypothetical protein